MTIDDFAKGHMSSGVSLAKKYPSRAENVMTDRLLSLTHSAMKEKLIKKANEGRGGWWDEDECSIDQLKLMLEEHVNKGDMVDVMNIAAMIYCRECMAEPEHI